MKHKGTTFRTKIINCWPTDGDTIEVFFARLDPTKYDSNELIRNILKQDTKDYKVYDETAIHTHGEGVFICWACHGHTRTNHMDHVYAYKKFPGEFYDELAQSAQRVTTKTDQWKTVTNYVFYDVGVGERDVRLVRTTLQGNSPKVPDHMSMSYRGRRHQIPAHSHGRNNDQKMTGYEKRWERKQNMKDLLSFQGLSDEEYFYDLFQ